MQLLKFDVMIIGGGLEAALLAWQAHCLKLRVCLIDQGRPRDPEQPYDCWTCSPFLYSAAAWQDVQGSLPFWRDWKALRQRDGLAVAQRESESWQRLQSELAVENWDREAFPELLLPAPVGSLFLANLPVVASKGLVPSIWRELARQGASTEVDRWVHHIDWEHEWPTAVSQDTIYRARRLFLTAPKLLGQELPALAQKQLLLEGKPLLPEARLFERPASWVHYAKAPLYLDPRQDRWGLVRLTNCLDEKAERAFLQEAAARWLGCPLQESAYYELTVPGQEDGLPVFDHHPWREDCIWMGGIGQTHWPWLPAYLSRLLELPFAADLRMRTPVAT